MNVNSVIDLLIVVLFISLGFKGFLRGFVKELGGLIELIILIYLLANKTSNFQEFMKPYIELNYWQSLLLFFLGIHLTFMIIISFFNLLVEKISLMFFNRLLGILLGFAKALLIVETLIFLINLQKLINPQLILGSSKLIPMFEPLVKYIFKFY